MDFRKNKPHRTSTSTQTKHRLFLDELRNDFHQRCGYCDLHDSQMWWKEQFEVDHFIPQSVDETKKLDYSNLVYSCRLCNRFKSDKYSDVEPCFIDPEDSRYWELFTYDKDMKFLPNLDNENSKYIFRELKFYLWLRQKLNILNEFNYIENKLSEIQDTNPDILKLYQKIANFRQKLYS